MKYKISFPETSYEPVVLHENADLSEHLTVMNSPMLFGCRSGICGTCLVEVVSGLENLPLPDEEEKEALDLYAADNPNARLACQIKLSSDIALRKIDCQ